MQLLGAFLLFVINSHFVRAGAGVDPLNNFCRRWYHQSQVKNNTLFIDGGLETFSDRTSQPSGGSQPGWVGEITTGPNNYLIAVDLSTSWNWKTNIDEVSRNKTTDPGTGNSVPKVQSGAIFHGLDSDPKVYLYGGVAPTINETFHPWQQPTSSQYTLWGYDYADDTWTQYNVFPSVPERPSWGASTEAANIGLAFYLNGIVTNWSSPDPYSTNLKNQVVPLDGLVVLNLTDHTASNRSTSVINNARPIIRGGMVYLPTVGEKGILITVGGASCNGASCDESRLNIASMSAINIFNIASLSTANSATSSNGWTTQTVSNGSIPDPRIDFCAVLISAPDGSSHNLYLYGGWDPTTGTLYDDVWVLTIPAFRWIKSYGGTSPRYGHTCHIVGNNQMITVGGLDSINEVDSCDWEYMSVAIWNLTENTGNGWGSIYTHDAAPYQVPYNIYSVIGGGQQGNASKLLPDGGWNNTMVAKLFTGTTNLQAPAGGPSNQTNSSNPPASSKKGISSGAITGAVVGSVAGLSIIIATIFCWRRKLQKKKKAALLEGEQAAAKDEEYHKSELENTEAMSPVEMSGEKVFQLDSNNLPVEVGGNHVSELPGSPVSAEADSRELHNYINDIAKRG